MHTDHWIQNLPEAGTEAHDIARRYAAAMRALREAEEMVRELDREAETYAASEWTETEIAEARQM